MKKTPTLTIDTDSMSPQKDRLIANNTTPLATKMPFFNHNREVTLERIRQAIEVTKQLPSRFIVGKDGKIEGIYDAQIPTPSFSHYEPDLNQHQTSKSPSKTHAPQSPTLNQLLKFLEKQRQPFSPRSVSHLATNSPYSPIGPAHK